MKNYICKSLIFVLIISMVIGCAILVGCEKRGDNEDEQKSDVETAQEILDNATSYLNACRMTSKSWYAESESDLENMIASNTGALVFVEERDGKNFSRKCLEGYDGAYDTVIFDNMVYIIGEEIPDYGVLPDVNFFNPYPMHKYPFEDNEYDAMMESVIGKTVYAKATHYKNVAITKLDGGKTKLVMSEPTELYYEECVFDSDITILKLEIEIIVDSQGRFLTGTSVFAYDAHYEDEFNGEIYVNDISLYSYTEVQYEYDNIKVSAPKNADEFVLTEYEWKKISDN